MVCVTTAGFLAVAFAVRGIDALAWSATLSREVGANDSDGEANSTALAAALLKLAASGRHGRINYMRIPKTGSSSIERMMEHARKTNPACDRLLFHGHSTFPTDEDMIGEKTFTVIRSPCERYLSQWDHVRRRNDGAPHYDACDSGMDAPAHEALQSPNDWAEYMLRNQHIRLSYFDRNFVYPNCQSMIVMFPQSKWVSDDTEVACLPDMVSEVNQYLAKELPGCQLEELDQEVNVRRHRADDETTCSLAKRLYPEDVRLWNSKCGAKHGFV